ncbi:MAG: sodium-dependent dicarboxylate transporter 2/3/5 [Gammaproteobacteria bacterium]|jgi:sodium-dependent dicarboxylate transporter 2/3/5
MSRANIGLIAGLSLFAILVLMPTPDGMPIEAKHVAAVATLMAIFWMTEAIPIPATSLIPIFLYPLLKVMPGTQVTLSYANHLIYLYMGGFLIAVTMEKWNLHKRIALQTIRVIGITPDKIVLGFMVATGFLSMWISNTAAAMMMVTIAMAVVSQVIKGIGDDDTLSVDTRVGHFRFGAALMLGIAYAASIGGVATLVGTPTNAVFAGIVESTFGVTISLVDWMKIGFPIAVVTLFTTWFLLVKVIYPSEITHLPGGKEIIHRELKSLGNMSKEEKMVLAIFSTVATLWILRGFVKIDAISMVADSTIAIGGAVLLFMLPSNFKKREFLLDWDTAVKIPWDILLLFGGGFALATGFSESGLTTYMAGKLTILEGTSIYLIIPVVATMIIFLTELTSNTATNSIMLPIMAALAGAMMIHPFGLMITTTIAASFAFMLPVATPPNAIVFGSRSVTIDQMMKAGIWLNILGIIFISVFILFLLPIVWDIDLTSYSLPIQN